MPKQSAGVLLYRRKPEGIEVLLVHPGGPFWWNRDEGAWSIPKGETHPDEELIAAATREFFEETAHAVTGPFIPLASVRLKSGKAIHGFAAEGDLDPRAVRSNSFKAEWPPRSGKIAEYPEVDKAAFFTLDEARVKLHPAQVPFLDRLSVVLECDTP